MPDAPDETTKQRGRVCVAGKARVHSELSVVRALGRARRQVCGAR